MHPMLKTLDAELTTCNTLKASLSSPLLQPRRRRTLQRQQRKMPSHNRPRNKRPIRKTPRLGIIQIRKRSVRPGIINPIH